METKFIAGPWSFVPSIPEEGFECYWIENGVQRITPIEGPQNKEREATARLIATAPELFEALQAFVDEVDGTFPFESLDKARTALAKATGEKS